jgi:hypothetical protein
MGQGRAIAEFFPQAWQDAYAAEVDPEGETTRDVTDHVVALGRNAALALRDSSQEADELRLLPNAPERVREWRGPFLVRVEDRIAEYFGASPQHA